MPVTMETGIRTFFCGPESFTPDLQPVVGEAPELRNYFVAAGLNSIGILTGGGLGRVLAHWITTGRPDVDVTGFNIDRLHRYQTNPEYRATRTVESLGLVYQCHYPNRSMQTARGAKRSPVHDRLAAAGRPLPRRERMGRRRLVPARPASPPSSQPLTWGRPPWFPYWQAEHEAAREGVIAHGHVVHVQVPRSRAATPGALLDHLSANDVDAEPGTITYTQWLDDAGRLQADLTVTKLDDDRFWVVATDTAHRHVETLMRRHFDGSHAFVADMTSAYAQLNVQGPLSRELLQTLTSADLSNEAFPFRTAREIDLGFARVLCVRITYLGELGYELYIPAEQAVHVYDRLVDAGTPIDLRHAGLKALASLRMEKGYRDYGHDIDNTDSVIEAGLGFFVDLDKPGGFVGRDAVAAAKAAGPLDPAPGPGPGDRSRTAAVPRRGRPSRRRPRRLRPSRLLRPHPRRRGRPGHDRGRPASPSPRPTWTRASGRSTSPAAATRPWPRSSPLYDPDMKRVRA